MDDVILHSYSFCSLNHWKNSVMYFSQFLTKHRWNSQCHGYGSCSQSTGKNPWVKTSRKLSSIMLLNSFSLISSSTNFHTWKANKHSRRLVWPFLGPNMGTIPFLIYYVFFPYFRTNSPQKSKTVWETLKRPL